jgi:GNAT superfamily N-acetyltransferase
MKMNLELKPLHECPADGGIALQWSLDLWGEHIPGFSREDWMRFYENGEKANFLRWEGDGQELIYIGKLGREVVGTIAIVDFDELEDFRHLTPWIAAFVVKPNLRGQGIGSHMLASLEKEAKRLGIERLYLWTQDQSPFYMKRGYQHFAKANLGVLSLDVLSKVFT